MIQPRRLKLAGKSQKQIIDGLTARNLEMHMDNVKVIEELATAVSSNSYLALRNKMLEDLCKQNNLKVPELLGNEPTKN